jgi:hypothetical protein
MAAGAAEPSGKKMPPPEEAGRGLEGRMQYGQGWDRIAAFYRRRTGAMR